MTVKSLSHHGNAAIIATIAEAVINGAGTLFAVTKNTYSDIITDIYTMRCKQ